jgi:hypothetical protein
MAKDKVYTQEMGKPPNEPDGGSVGRKYVPERLGSGIMVQPDYKTRDKKPAPAPLPNDKPGSRERIGMQNLAKGGTASARADGCAQRGKTRGMMV